MPEPIGWEEDDESYEAYWQGLELVVGTDDDGQCWWQVTEIADQIKIAGDDADDPEVAMGLAEQAARDYRRRKPAPRVIHHVTDDGVIHIAEIAREDRDGYAITMVWSDPEQPSTKMLRGI